jgi:hypothetical protein
MDRLTDGQTDIEKNIGRCEKKGQIIDRGWERGRIRSELQSQEIIRLIIRFVSHEPVTKQMY